MLKGYMSVRCDCVFKTPTRQGLVSTLRRSLCMLVLHYMMTDKAHHWTNDRGRPAASYIKPLLHRLWLLNVLYHCVNITADTRGGLQA